MRKDRIKHVSSCVQEEGKKAMWSGKRAVGVDTRVCWLSPAFFSVSPPAGHLTFQHVSIFSVKQGLQSPSGLSCKRDGVCAAEAGELGKVLGGGEASIY